MPRPSFCCDACGRSGARAALRLVAVMPRCADVPGADTLTLCRECENRPDRTIWRRYRRAEPPGSSTLTIPSRRPCAPSSTTSARPASAA